jgi:serine/threonine-protein kinase HipA
MSPPTAFVYVDLGGCTYRVGRLWSLASRGREGASFEYDADWLRHPERFSLEPALEVGPGTFHTAGGRALFGALGDSAPDRWGRSLIARNERRQANREHRQPRTLRESDYLLGVSDITRSGALRYKDDVDGPFLADGIETVPPLIELPRLLAAASHFEADDETDQDLRLLLAPGSSLGGARPKASVRDRDGSLAIAKFPSRADDINVVRWEAVALELARRAAIPTVQSRIEHLANQDVLIIRRFDRVRPMPHRVGDGIEHRVPFLSAMSMLDAVDREVHSYIEIADALRHYGADTAADLLDLWRRIVFNVLVSNLDDHLRNHGFLYAGPDGWRLSPAYDVNPVPVDVKPRFLTTTITSDEDTSASIELALDISREFGVHEREAREIARDIADVVQQWREVAMGLGLKASECDRMASAFEHKDAETARRG